MPHIDENHEQQIKVSRWRHARQPKVWGMAEGLSGEWVCSHPCAADRSQPLDALGMTFDIVSVRHATKNKTIKQQV